MRVDTCCCGCNLRSGTIAIGCFYACTSVGAAIFFFTWKPSSYHGNTFLMDSGVLSCVCMIAGIVMLTQMLAAVCLVYGVKRDKRGFFVPWMIVNAMYLLLALALLTSYIVAGVSTGEIKKTILAIVEGVYIGLLIYFLIVVHSYRKSLSECKTAPGDP